MREKKIKTVFLIAQKSQIKGNLFSKKKKEKKRRCSYEIQINIELHKINCKNEERKTPSPYIVHYTFGLANNRFTINKFP